MAEQSLLAIEEADVVLFMVDARAGLMPADSAIAKHLRSREKPTFPVANKTDGIDADQAIADFWSLGPAISILSRPRMAVASPACWKPFCCRGLMK